MAHLRPGVRSRSRGQRPWDRGARRSPPRSPTTGCRGRTMAAREGNVSSAREPSRTLRVPATGRSSGPIGSGVGGHRRSSTPAADPQVRADEHPSDRRSDSLWLSYEYACHRHQAPEGLCITHPARSAYLRRPSRVVESLLATLARRDLLEEAVKRWGEIVESDRPDRERELAALEARIRRAQGALDRYFQTFEEGRLREEVCTQRIEELSVKLTSLEVRRGELVEESAGSQPSVPEPTELAELVEKIDRGSSPERSPPRTQGRHAGGGRRDQRPGSRPYQAGLSRPGIWTTVWIGALGRIRTCAPGSGGRCSIP